jgi:hypothetical protein
MSMLLYLGATDRFPCPRRNAGQSLLEDRRQVSVGSLPSCMTTRERVPLPWTVRMILTVNAGGLGEIRKACRYKQIAR